MERNSKLTLFATRGIAPPVVDAIETLWRRARGQLRGGETLLLRESGGGQGVRPLASEGVAVLPVFDGEELLALLYLDGPAAGLVPVADLEWVARLSRTVARSVARVPEPPAAEPADVESYLERTPVADIHRQKLLLLLERNRWNIAQVARLMGVTRRTIYMRLRRYGIARRRVYRTRVRRVAS